MHYAVDIGDVRLIALDSSVPGAPHGNLGEAQLAWLDATLAASTRRRSSPCTIPPHSPALRTWTRSALPIPQPFPPSSRAMRMCAGSCAAMSTGPSSRRSAIRS